MPKVDLKFEICKQCVIDFGYISDGLRYNRGLVMDWSDILLKELWEAGNEFTFWCPNGSTIVTESNKPIPPECPNFFKHMQLDAVPEGTDNVEPPT